jgi:ADP-heptose:LPS heptosyltransferase
MDSMNERDEVSQVGFIAHSELLDQLNRKEIRIRELEKLVRQQELQLERVSSAVRDVINEPRLISKFSAARIDEAIKTLTTVQRRDAWLAELTRLGLSGPLFGLYPHAGNSVDSLTILVVGSGGFGDMLYLTTVIKALYDQFDEPRIVVVHEHPLANQVLGKNNPYLLDAIHIFGSKLAEFLDVVSSLDVFDLVAEVRYAVSYIAPPLSRIPSEFLRVAQSKAVKWQRYVRYDWPHLNNYFAREVIGRGMGKLDLVGETANLPISRETSLQYFPVIDPIAAWIGDLRGVPYITVHHGADKNMSTGKGLQTKNLPLATWAEIARYLKAAGFAVVQLGEINEDLIPGIDYDFRGRTSFDETAYVIKCACIHVDTEGGLVHVARAVNTRSVVMFGPTPVEFFGYPSNANVSSMECGNCWWTTRDWAVKCPRGLESPSCMAEHVPQDVAQIVLTSANQWHRGTLEKIEMIDTAIVSVAERLVAQFDSAPDGGRKTMLLYFDGKSPGSISGLFSALQRRSRRGIDDIAIVPCDMLRAAKKASGGWLAMVTASNGSTPLETESYGAGIAVLESSDIYSNRYILCDLLRSIESGGRLHAIVDGFFQEIVDCLAERTAGAKYMIDVSPIAQRDGSSKEQGFWLLDFLVSHCAPAESSSLPKKASWMHEKLKIFARNNG